jgi:hypothetical protein
MEINLKKLYDLMLDIVDYTIKMDEDENSEIQQRAKSYELCLYLEKFFYEAKKKKDFAKINETLRRYDNCKDACFYISQIQTDSEKGMKESEKWFKIMEHRFNEIPRPENNSIERLL